MVLHYIVFTLHDIVLHGIALHGITLHGITLHHMVFHYITSLFITWHCITYHYFALRCYIALYYITSRCLPRSHFITFFVTLALAFPFLPLLPHKTEKPSCVLVFIGSSNRYNLDFSETYKVTSEPFYFLEYTFSTLTFLTIQSTTSLVEFVSEWLNPRSRALGFDFCAAGDV